jgi:hypothetical protein
MLILRFCWRLTRLNNSWSFCTWKFAKNATMGPNAKRLSRLEIAADQWSGKKLHMIGGKAEFPTWKKQGSHDCRSPWSGTLGTLFQGLVYVVLYCQISETDLPNIHTLGGNPVKCFILLFTSFSNSAWGNTSVTRPQLQASTAFNFLPASKTSLA